MSSKLKRYFLLLFLVLFASGCSKPTEVTIPFSISTTYDLEFADSSKTEFHLVHRIDLTDNNDFSQHLSHLDSVAVDSVQIHFYEVNAQDSSDFIFTINLTSPDSVKVIPFYEMPFALRPDSMSREGTWQKIEIPVAAKSLLAQLIHDPPHQAMFVIDAKSELPPKEVKVNLKVFWAFTVKEDLL